MKRRILTAIIAMLSITSFAVTVGSTAVTTIAEPLLPWTNDDGGWFERIFNSKAPAGGSATTQRADEKIVILGDTDLNGKVDAKDARLALRASAKLETLTPAQKAVADINGDGTVSAGDARRILRFSALLA